MMKPEQTIFVNRGINLAKIKYIGFDMDYTLALYDDLEYNTVMYDSMKKKLIQKGYPKELLNVKYDNSFITRGIVLDKYMGNLLKIDNFGYILKCFHGRTDCSGSIRQFYPEKIINVDDESFETRFVLIDSLFVIPAVCLVADIIDLIEKDKTQSANSPLSYKHISDDVRSASNACWMDGSVTKEIIACFSKFLVKDKEKSVGFRRDLKRLLKAIKASKKKIFLMTNSPPFYAQLMMSYLLSDETYEGEAKTSSPNTKEGKKVNMKTDKSWMKYFDIVIANANKPKFFETDAPFREFDVETGEMKFTKMIDNEFNSEKIYCYGCLSLFKKLTNTKGPEVLYVGDNILHDIAHVKKSKCLWRTYILIQELNNELKVTENNKKLIKSIRDIEKEYKNEFVNQNALNYDYSDENKKKKEKRIAEIKLRLRQKQNELDKKFGTPFGSLFHSGSSYETYFSSVMKVHADLYSSSFVELLNYSLDNYFYPFDNCNMQLPHMS